MPRFQKWKGIQKKLVEWLRFAPLWERVIFTGIVLLILFSAAVIYRNSRADQILPSHGDSEAFYLYDEDTFSVEFGSRDYPNIHRVRFEATPGDDSLPEDIQKKRTFWQQLISLLSGSRQTHQRKGIEFLLVGIQNSESLHTLQGIDTSTKLQNIDGSQQILNESVVQGVDISYDVINGRGIKEDITVYRSELPALNQFIFALHMDEGLEVRKSLTQAPSPTWYIVDDQERYIAHFENLSAVDALGASTSKVDLTITGSLLIITVDHDWISSPSREFPIKIDPTIVHDTTSEFLGTFNRTELKTEQADAGEELTPESLEENTSEFTEHSVDANTVALWHMNDDWDDISGNSNHGTAANGATFSTSSKLGSHAGSFDGGDDYVSVSDNVSLRLTDFTLEAWVNPNLISGDNRTLIHKGDSNTNDDWNYIFRINSGGTLHIEAGSGTGGGNQQFLNGNATIPTNTWTHIAATVDDTNNEFKLYVNGELDAEGAMTISPNDSDTSTLHIGRRKQSSFDDPYNGLIDEVRVSNIVRTPEEIETSAGLRLLALYHMNNDWSDSSGHGNNATPGSTSFTSSAKLGSHSGDFSGTSNYVQVSDSGSLNPKNITISTWFKRGTTLGTTQWLAAKRTSDGNFYDYAFNFDTSNFLRSYVENNGNGNSSLLVTPFSITDQDWHHVAMTFDDDNNTHRLYVDGKLADENTGISFSLANTTQPIIIGALTSVPDQAFDGFFDEFSIYGEVLSEEEIRLAAQTNTLLLMHMDNDWTDSSANENDGTATGATFTTDAIVGSHSGNFDGNDYVSIPVSESLTIADTMTIEAWVKLNSTSDSIDKIMYVRRSGTSNGEAAFQFRFGSTTAEAGKKLILQTNTAGGGWSHAYSNDDVIVDTDWHHYAATVSSGTVKMYVDGEEVAVTGSVAAPLAAGDIAYIGARPSKSEFMSGFIDELHISRDVKGTAEIQTAAALEPQVQIQRSNLPADFNTRLLMHLENDWSDGSINNYSFTTDGVVFSEDSAVGEYAVDFDGGDDFANVNALLANDTSSFTYELWAKADNSGDSDQFIMGQSMNGTNNDYCLSILYTYSSKNISLSSNTGSSLFNYSYNLADWTHVAISVNQKAGRSILYINGIPVDYDGIPVCSSAEAAQFRFGKSPNAAHNLDFNGLIDEVRITNYPRTSEQIAASATRYPYGEYTSEVIDLGTSVTAINSINWSEQAVNALFTSSDGVVKQGEPMPVGTDDLFAAWYLNETSGTTATNQAGAGTCGGTESSCNGTLSGFSNTTGQDVVFGSGWTSFGQYGRGGVRFNGTTDDDFINIPDQTLDPMSLSLWFKYQPKSSSWTDAFIVDGQATSLFSLGVLTSNKTLNFYTYDGTLHTLSTEPLVENTWNHVVITYNGGEKEIYLNGELAGTQTGPSSNPTIYGFGINSDEGPSFYWPFTGTLDSILLYGRVLTSDEVENIYASGRTNIQLQTRTGSDDTPNDGTWEEWKPISGETQLESFDGYLYPADSSNLVSYWPMDEETNDTCTGGSNDVCDATGSNDALKSGDVLINDGIFGNGRYFDGDADSISTGQQSSLVNFGTGDFALSTWFNSNLQTTEFQDIVGYSTTSAESRDRYSLSLFPSDHGTNPNKLQFAIGEEGQSAITIASNNQLAGDNQWHHILAQRVSGTIYLYIDGIQQTATANASSVNLGDFSNSSFNIGYSSYPGFPFYFTGGIDEVRVFSNSLSLSDIRNITLTGNTSVNLRQERSSLNQEGTTSKKITQGGVNITPDVLLHLPFDETNGDLAGDDVFDRSTYSNDGEINGTSVVDGVSGKARSFNGSSDYIQIPNAPSLNPTEEITLSAWWKPTATSWTGAGNDPIIDKPNTTTDPPHYQYHLGVHNTTRVITLALAINGSDTTCTTTAAANVLEWNHIVGTYDGSVMKVYLNGIPSCTNSVSGTLSTYATDVYLNKYGNLSFYLPGESDDIQIRDRALTESEILGQFQGGIGSYSLTNISTSNLQDSSLFKYFIAADRPGTFLSSIIGESDFDSFLPDENTRGFWKLEEDSTSTTAGIVEDKSIYNNNGQLGGGTSSAVPKLIAGNVGGAKRFDGDDYIAIPDNPSLQMGTSDFSLSTWIYTDGTAQKSGVITKRDTSNFYTIALRFGDSPFGGGPGNKIFAFLRPDTGSAGAPGPQDRVITSETLNPGWHYVVAVNDYDSNLSLYIDGVLEGTDSTSHGGKTLNISGFDWEIGRLNNGDYFAGVIDEVRIDTVALSHDQVKQAYESSKRTHNVTIDFGASLDSGDLIANQGDTSFTIDATTLGLPEKGSFLYKGDTVIVKEEYGGVEYISQGIVDSVDISTGAVTVSSWKVASTVPSGGFTSNADVFKWQEEYIDLQTINWTHKDAIANLTFLITNKNEGRTIWIDDARHVSNYLTDPDATLNVASTLGRYLQYNVIETAPSGYTTPYLQNVTIDYSESGGGNSVSPTFTVVPFEDPASYGDDPTDQGSNVTFKATATDGDGDQYYLAICKTSNITANDEAAPTCDDGEWCVSTTTSSNSQSTCNYTTQAGDGETSGWYGFACDDVDGSLCSSFQSGSGDSGSPFSVNHDPDFAAVTDNGGTGIDSAADPGGDIIFTATASDADTDGAADTVTMVVCTDNTGATSSGCTGTQLCASTSVSANPTCTYNIPPTQTGGLFDYYAYVFDNHDLAADANPIMGQYEISNDDPVVSNIIINNGNDISLTENTTTDITFTATVTDANSCEDIDSVTGYLYRSGVTQSGCDSGGEADDNYCYADITCTFVTSGNTCDDDTDSSAEYECTASIQYHADPTDVVTEYPGENWLASVTATDTAAANDTSQSSGGVELLSLTAIDITESFSYGSLDPGQDTGSTNQLIVIYATGNVGIDTEVSGTDLTLGASAIDVANQEYALNSFTYGNGTDLSGIQTEVEINIIKTLISGSPSNGTVYWGLFIPNQELLSGLYTGTNTITGVKSEVEEW